MTYHGDTWHHRQPPSAAPPPRPRPFPVPDALAVRRSMSWTVGAVTTLRPLGTATESRRRFEVGVARLLAGGG